MTKIESIQKRAFQLLHNDLESNYSQLLGKVKKSTMTILRLCCLYIEMYKTINRLNPAFMTDIFKLSDPKKPIRNKTF